MSKSTKSPTTIRSSTAESSATARAVRRLRLRADLTQAELGERTGITDETIGRIECGRVIASVSTLCKLADAFGCQVDELLGRPARLPPPAAAALLQLYREATLPIVPPGMQAVAPCIERLLVQHHVLPDPADPEVKDYGVWLRRGQSVLIGPVVAGGFYELVVRGDCYARLGRLGVAADKESTLITDRVVHRVDEHERFLSVRCAGVAARVELGFLGTAETQL